MRAEKFLDFLLSAVGTAWIEFIMVVLIIGFANLVKGLNPLVLRPEGKPLEPMCQEIVLPQLENKDSGFLKKLVKPHTELAPLLGLDAEFYTVTGYAVGDGYTPGEITADGRKVRPGITVACPPEIMLGTAVYIEGLGVRICEDRGSAIVGKRLDVAFKTPEAAIMFGKRWMRVAVIR